MAVWTDAVGNVCLWSVRSAVRGSGLDSGRLLCKFVNSTAVGVGLVSPAYSRRHHGAGMSEETVLVPSAGHNVESTAAAGGDDKVTIAGGCLSAVGVTSQCASLNLRCHWVLLPNAS